MVRGRRIAAGILFSLIGWAAAGSAADWDNSALRGTAAPPTPFVTEPAFTGLDLGRAVALFPLPAGDGRLVAAELAGTVWTFADRDDVTSKDRFLRLPFGSERNGRWKSEATLYDIAFAPDYPETPAVYVCYHRQREDGPFNTLSRFRVAVGPPPTAVLDSEEVLLEWQTGGHDGCDLEFGPDGMLYVSTGDGGQPRDPDNIGQRADNLLGSILRIDVSSRPDPGLPYVIPADNPFVGRPDARPEVWAYGLRNPWRMAFDAEGRLWVGDNGEELWEMIHLVGRGTNHGWSRFEGSHLFRPSTPLGGPTPVHTPPVIEHPHTEARSIIGGLVVTGDTYPSLTGSYVYGDYVTGHHWACDYADGRVMNRRRIAAGPRFQAYGTDTRGHLYVLRNDRGVERLVAAGQRKARPFPTRLSETGLYASVAERQLAPGVQPSTVSQPLWRDGAVVERFVAVPPGTRLKPQPRGGWQLPDGGVAGLTILLPDAAGGLRPIETQLIYHEASLWNFFSFAWDADGREAHLVPPEGRFVPPADFLPPLQVGAAARQGWRFQSRADCGICHTQASNFVLGLTSPLPARSDDAAADLAARLAQEARQYLHVQCSHCHNSRNQMGRAELRLEWWLPTAETGLIDAMPVLGGFGLDRPRLVAPGAADRSVLLYRMASSGPGRMPQLGCQTVDRDGLQLVARWIDSLPHKGEPDSARFVRSPAAGLSPSAALRLLLDPAGGFAAGTPRPDRLAEIVAAVRGGGGQHLQDLFAEWLPDDLRSAALGSDFDAAELLAIQGDAARGRQLFVELEGLSCRNCHRHGGQGGSSGPDLSLLGSRMQPAEILEAIRHPARQVADRYRLWQMLTADGRLVTGTLVRESAATVVMADGRGELVSVPTAEIDERQLLPGSPMPANLLAGLTPQQAADLLAFLARGGSE